MNVRMWYVFIIVIKLCLVLFLFVHFDIAVSNEEDDDDGGGGAVDDDDLLYLPTYTHSLSPCLSPPTPL